MRTHHTITRSLLAPLRLLALLFVACHLGQETKVEDTLSFTKQYETLSKFDTVRIEVRDESGRTLAIVYHGKVDSLKEIQNLSVPGWNGGPIAIVISGYAAGNPEPIYQEEKNYDGTTRTTGGTKVLIHPNPGLSAGSLLLQINEGQSVPLPQVDIAPPNLAQTALEWSSSNSQVAQVLDGRVVGGIAGSAQLTAKLVAYPGKTLVFEVQVQSDPMVPASITLDRDTLYLAENGAPQAFGIEIKPTTASSEVVWTLEDSTLVALRSDGSFQGLKPGVTKAWVASKLKASVKDMGILVVSEPIPVSSVAFLKQKTTLFVRGAPEILSVEVLPAKANPAVDFSLSDDSKASLRGDTLRPLAEGVLSVFVRSREDTTKADTLEVTIEVPVPVTQVEASESALTLYVRGESKTVTAKVYPANAPQTVSWMSLSQTVATVGQATGVIQPLKSGLAPVVAVSLADSSRKDTILVSVKEDVPVLDVGKDTTVSSGQTVTFLPTVTQDYGQVVLYKWDLDGNLQWDDSATAISPKSFQYEQPKEYAARFYVRDTEGNESIKTRRVMVVSSATVVITAPPDNSHTNQKVIPVAWSVNGKLQDTLTSETLSALGPNTITRTARDSAGKEVSHSITVHYDTTAPSRPNIAGTSPTNVKPRWTWSSGGGGSGDFRIRLGDDAFPANAPATRDTVHTLSADPVTGTTYTLFVQERDLAGNWSPSASLAIVYNVTQPVVVIQSPRASGTHYSAAAAVTLNGTATGPVAISKVTYKVGSAAAVNATFASGAWSTPALPLVEGVATVVTITATDIAGNTGETALTLFHDETPPSAPTITTGPTGNISVLRGSLAWSSGNDGTSGSGLNGRYRYSLNNGAWKDTNATLLTDLPLPEGNVVFSVQEQDRALNWSTSATRSFKADTTPPVLSLTSHANPYASTGLTITLAGQVRDSISGVASMTVAGQVSGSGTVTVTGTGWSTVPLTLASGVNNLVITALDQVGNTRTLNLVVNVNVPAPVVNITSPANNHLTRNDTVIVSYTIDGTAGSRSFTLTEGSNSLVISSLPNASGNIGRDTVVVRRDATAPNAPALTAVTASPTRASVAVWTWVSGGDNTGGAGLPTPASYRYQVNGGSWNPSNAARLELTAEGSHSVVVQEQDRAGNWSPSSQARTIVIDRTGPTVVILTRNNFATNTSPASIRYTVDGVEATPSNCALSNVNGSRSCSVSATDGLGNPTNASITVWFRPDTYFLTPDGVGNGSSWDSPSSDLRGMLVDDTKEGKELWLGTGTYSADLFVNQKMTILGGFNAASQPFDTTGRNKTSTHLGHLTADFNADLFIDGVSFSSFWDRIAPVTLTNVQIRPKAETATGLRVIDGGVFTAKNLTIVGQTFGNGAVEVSWSTATFIGGSIVNNNGGDGYGIAISGGGTVRLSGGISVYGNTSPIQRGQILLGQGSNLIVDPDVNFDCSDEVVNEGGTITCP